MSEDADEEMRRVIGPPGLKKHAKGAHSELIACAWLISRGYEVFRNVSSGGPVDLVAINGDEVLKIDVKSSSVRQAVPLRKHQAGVVALYVYSNGECELNFRPPLTARMGERAPSALLSNLLEGLK